MAMGVLGLSLDEFDNLTPTEFTDLMQGRREKQEADREHDEKLTRRLAFYVVTSNPYLKKYPKKEQDLYAIGKEIQAKKNWKPPTEEEVLKLLEQRKKR